MQRNIKQQFLLTKIENKNPLINYKDECIDFIGLYHNIKHTFINPEPDFKKEDTPDVVLSWICSELQKTTFCNEWMFYKDPGNRNSKLLEFFSLEIGQEELFGLPISFMIKIEDSNVELFKTLQMFLLKFNHILFNTTAIDTSDYYVETLKERVDFAEQNGTETESEIDEIKNDIMIYHFIESDVFNRGMIKETSNNKMLSDLKVWNRLKRFKPKSIPEIQLLASMQSLFRLYKKGFSINLFDAIPPSLNDDTGLIPITSTQMFQITWTPNELSCPISNNLIDYFDGNIRETGMEVIVPVGFFITDEKNKRLTYLEQKKLIIKYNVLWKEYLETMGNFQNSLINLCKHYE